MTKMLLHVHGTLSIYDDDTAKPAVRCLLTTTAKGDDDYLMD
jgi:hypothetical protein